MAARDFKHKITQLHKASNAPFIILVATAKDQYRKPDTAMWDYFCKQINSGYQINLQSSFFVGDAAGRPRKEKRKQDFSDADRLFAKKIGVQYFTPEMFFAENFEDLNYVTPGYKVETESRGLASLCTLQ